MEVPSLAGLPYSVSRFSGLLASRRFVSDGMLGKSVKVFRQMSEIQSPQTAKPTLIATVRGKARKLHLAKRTEEAYVG